MITPALQLTATERVLPRLALDFTTGTLDPRITFTRSGNTATRINASGAIETVNADTPRFDFDPVTLACKGLLIEELRKNLLLNTDSLATQNVTVAAVAHTLSFYGDGQVVLSGTHLSTVTGTGAYPLRKTYTFTPTAGTLTVTVTGTVQYAQLEAGAFATSYIPTTTTALTRNADVATMTGTNFSDWFNATQGSMFIGTYSTPATSAVLVRMYPNAGGNSANNTIYFDVNPNVRLVTFNGASATVCNTGAKQTFGTKMNVVGGYKVNSFAASQNAVNPVTQVSGGIPAVTPDTLAIGSTGVNTSYVNGWITEFMYWPQRLTNAEVQAFSK